jgi:hypothetical protein
VIEQGQAMAWMGWRRDRGEAQAEPSAAETRHLDGEGIRLALETRGVSRELGELLAARLEDRLAGISSESADAMLDGVALALDLHDHTTEDVARSLRGLKEVERMMGAFSGELSKLDEVLEVLAAYVARMRTSGSSETVRTLH